MVRVQMSVIVETIINYHDCLNGTFFFSLLFSITSPLRDYGEISALSQARGLFRNLVAVKKRQYGLRTSR